MGNHEAGWWAERVAELAAGGDADGIARRHGVRPKTLIWWRSELRRRAREASSSAGAVTPRLLPVVVTPRRASVPAAGGEAVELVVDVGAARITMRGEITPKHLAALVAAAVRTC